MELVKSVPVEGSDEGTERFIVPADKLRPGDLVSEYGAVVASVAQGAHLGVREITFDGQPGTFFIHFMEWFHVQRAAGAEDDEDQDDAPVRTNDWEW